jgi:cell wall assembly regulator SMI1
VNTREILERLVKVVPRAWGGSYIENFLKQRDPQPNMNWLLNMAAAGNQPEVVLELLAAGVDVHGKDHRNCTVRQYAYDLEVTRVLLEAGGEINTVDCGVEGYAASTWLESAVSLRKAETVRLLLEHEAGHWKYSPLINAAREGHAQVVRLLLDAGADVKGQGATAVWEASRNRGKAYLQIVQDLIAAGADVEGQGHLSPLMLAAEKGPPEMVRALIVGGADVNRATSFGTALHEAVRGNRADNIAALLEAGADPGLTVPADSRSEEAGMTPLDVARARRKKKLIPLLEAARAGAPAPGAAEGASTERSVPASWKRIETWLKKKAPEVRRSLGRKATPQEIERTEAALGVSLPGDVKESYRVHNGQPEDLALVPPPEEYDAGYSLLPLNRMAAEWRVWKELVDSGEFANDRCAPDTGIRDDWWNPGWMPFAGNGGGDFLCIDLAPADGGTSGQVITMFHAEKKRELLAPSFRDWLSNLADGLEGGEAEG